MPSTNKELLIHVRADIAKARADVRKMSEEIKRSGGAAREANQPVSKLGYAFRALSVAAIAYYTIQAAIKSLRMADEFIQLEQRIKTATQATGDFARVNQQLFDTAQDTGTALRDTVSTFQRLALARRELQATNDQILTVTKTVQQLGALSGASTTAMQAGLLQFGQAMSSTVVRAEEFNSLVENLPAVVDRIAIGMGMTTGELRQAVIEGRVLSREVFGALFGQAQDVAEEFEKIPDSMARSMLRLENAYGQLLTQIEEKLGVVQALADFVSESAKVVENSDSSFTGLLASSGVFGADAKKTMAEYTAHKQRLAQLNEEHAAIDKQVQAKRDELATLEEQISSKSLELLGTNPVSEQYQPLAAALDDLKAKRDELNKKIAETEALHQQVGKAGEDAAYKGTQGAIDYEAALKDVNLQLKNAISLHQQQSREAKRAAQDTQDLAKSFEEVRAGLGGASEPDYLSISSQTLKSEQLFNQGDYEGAVEAAEKARDMIEELGDSGTESELVLRGLLKRAEQAGLQAAQSIQAGKEASLQQTNQVISDLLARAEELKALKVGLDAAGAQAQANSLLVALQAQFAANPLVIPVTLSQSGDIKAPTEAPVQDYVTPKPIKRAGGGPLVGPGTGTSDSILMWGSNGEYMQPEASVKYYGLGFMELIRRRQLPRYADGGLVGAPALPSINMPVPAGGGGTPVNLYLDGKRYPVSAAADVADDLVREFRRETLKRGDV